jgi:hypothetical protein
VGIEGTPGMVTDGWKTFRLDNLESEVVGGTCPVHIQYYFAGEK